MAQELLDSFSKVNIYTLYADRSKMVLDSQATSSDQLFNASHMSHIETDYTPGLVALSAVMSLIGTLCGVLTMREFPRARSVKQQFILLVVFSLAVGGQAIWAMHYCALFALNIHFIDDFDHAEIPLLVRYNEIHTLYALAAGFAFLFTGSFVASRDPFFSKDKASQVETLQSLVTMKQAVRLSHRKLAFKALFAKPYWIISGGLIAGTGTSVVHFWGVDAKYKDHYDIEWNYPIAAASIVISISQFIVSYWLVFRLLQWRPKKESYRILSAIIMAAGCLSLHYVGMLAAKYKPVYDTDGPGEGLVSGTDMFFHTLLFAYIACAVILISLLYYITHYSLLTEVEKEMTHFVADLTQKANQNREPGAVLKEIKLLLDKYSRLFSSMLEHSLVKSTTKGKPPSIAPKGDRGLNKYGISDLTNNLSTPSGTGTFIT